jgi:3-phosphoshikimate 1-carboxyvinyltransferase
MRIRPAKRLRGRVCVPGDKSISHRAAIVAALARGRTRVENFSTSADCASTLRCLGLLGMRVLRERAGLSIDGRGREGGGASLSAPSGALDCGNSGTTMRLLAGVLAAQDFASTLAGDESLSGRPMRRVIEPLERMGARVDSAGGHAPLSVEGRAPLTAIEYASPVASAQVKSCVLLAGLGARGRTTVVEPGAGTRDHTERMLEWFGAEVETNAGGDGDAGSYTASVEGPARLAAHDLVVPGDISSAAFLIAAAALLPGSELTLEGVGLNPTRTEILSVLGDLSADVRVTDEGVRCNEPSGDVCARGRVGGLAPRARGANVLVGARAARLIDELPVLAVLGTQVEGGLEIRDAAELRVKESDRLSAVAANLRALGAEVEEFSDGLRVGGPTRLRGARLDSYGDHRIAMAFAVAALVADGETEIEGAEECVGVSFPEFFPLLESLAER